jgi:hypothetical protein
MGLKPEIKQLKHFEDDYGLKLEGGEETELGNEDEFSEGSEDGDGNGQEADLIF